QHAPRFAAQAQMAAAPPGISLPLLPSGPDGVRRPELRRSRPSTPFAAAGSENPDISDGIRSGHGGSPAQGNAPTPPPTPDDATTAAPAYASATPVRAGWGAARAGGLLPSSRHRPMRAAGIGR